MLSPLRECNGENFQDLRLDFPLGGGKKKGVKKFIEPSKTGISKANKLSAAP